MGPAYGLYLRFFGTREQIAGSMGVDMLPTAREALMDDDARAFMDLILVARDKVLLEHLGEARTPGGAKTVAVVYGARHMRAVIRNLTGEAGYRIARTEFVTVMSL